MRNRQQNEEWCAGKTKGICGRIKDPGTVLKDAGTYYDIIAKRAIEK